VDPFPSPLRYPGGKGKLANFIKLVFKLNNLLDGNYVEPYAGGASIALKLLFGEYVQNIYINDIDRSIYSFWYSVLNETESLCKLISDSPVSIKVWHKQKNIQLNLDNYSTLEIAFSTFFLNRTNRSGIINGGIIGGKGQNGKWKLDARFNKKELLRRITKIALYRERILLYNMDASKFIRKILPTLTSKTLVYFDPPYFVKGKELYANHYQQEDHEIIAELIKKKVKNHWIVSYDNNPQIIKLYKGYRDLSYFLSYSAAIKYRGSEVMFFSKKLKIPNVDKPTDIKAA